MGLGMSSSLENTIKPKIIDFQANQREVQMALGMAQARDMIQWIGGVWTGLASVATVATIKNKKPPLPLMIPLTVLTIVGAYQADFAYGTKMRRVVLETEYILENERQRFIPPKQAPFYHKYDNEISAMNDMEFGKATRVGEKMPTSIAELLGKLYN